MTEEADPGNGAELGAPAHERLTQLREEREADERRFLEATAPHRELIETVMQQIGFRGGKVKEAGTEVVAEQLRGCKFMFYGKGEEGPFTICGTITGWIIEAGCIQFSTDQFDCGVPVVIFCMTRVEEEEHPDGRFRLLRNSGTEPLGKRKETRGFLRIPA